MSHEQGRRTDKKATVFIKIIPKGLKIIFLEEENLCNKYVEKTRFKKGKVL